MTSKARLIEQGVRLSDSGIYAQDKIWSRYSHDKVDVGEELAKVVRTLSKAYRLATPLRALSVGSSDEPQFRILEPAFRGGLFLMDIDRKALVAVIERLKRQWTTRALPIYGDFVKAFGSKEEACHFRRSKLEGQRVHLITFHHSLYYAQARSWGELFDNCIEHLLRPVGAIHAVLMASKSSDLFTTTALYNRFAGSFCGTVNDQDLRLFAVNLRKQKRFGHSEIQVRTHKVRFYVDDFKKFMLVVWMILLYPQVHHYTHAQREKITEYVLEKFWLRKRPLVQEQDHLVLYRGLNFKGLV